MSQKSNSFHNSSESHSSKRRHQSESEDREVAPVERSPKRLSTTVVKTEPVEEEEPMNGQPLVFGRGRAFRRTVANEVNITTVGQPSKQTRAPTPPKQSAGPSHRSDGPTAGPSTETEDQKMEVDLKAAEEKSGLSWELMNALTNPFALGSKGIIASQANRFRPHNLNWFADVKKEEPKEEALDDLIQEKKAKGQQYVGEAQAKERDRAIQSQREERASQAAGQERTESPHASQPFQRHARRKQTPGNTSTLSLQTSVSTDIESVGTYLVPNIPETIEEDEDMSRLIGQYFTANKPKRTPLPISAYEKRILDAIHVSRVVVIEGATGCGKTTQVPQYIADDCAAKGLPFNIVVTQPRRIAAKSIAARVAHERAWQLGTIVGYQIGMDRQFVNEDTRLLYCTTGVLLQRLIGTQRLDHYSHIVIDEVHERSIDTDLLLLVIKKLMNARSLSVKIILMSATFDPQMLIDYFTIPILEGEDLINEVHPTHIKIDEKPHSLNIYYMKGIKNDLKIQTVQRDVREIDVLERDQPFVAAEPVEVAVAIIEKGLEIIEGKDGVRGAVLMFLPGLDEIHEVMARLRSSKDCGPKQWKIFPLHSSIPLDKQNEIFLPARGRERKIILATNIAESSITVPDVSYVIDFCLTKSLICDIDTHIPVLRMEWASKANCNQRAGRAGRVSEGRVYRLVEKVFYERLPEFSQPEITRSPLDLSILRVKMLNMGSPKDLLGLALDPPDLSDIYHSVLQLKQIGAFTVKTTERGRLFYDEEDGDITTLGIIVSHLPIDIRLGKLLVMGHVFDVLEDCIIIAACLSTQGMFRREFSQGLNAYKSRLAWADRSFSDGIAYLNAYKMYKRFTPEFDCNPRMAEKWCKQNFIQYKRIREVDYMFGELCDRLRRDNILIPIRPNMRRNRHEEELILKVVMCAAFYPNYYTRNQLEFENIPRQLGTKDPRSSVLIQGLPANEGPLYTHAIRDLFRVASKRIDIEFEDTKAYLSFLDDKHPLKEAFDLHIPLELKRERPDSSLSSVKSEIKAEGRDTPMSTTMSQSSSRAFQLKKHLKDTTIKTAVYVAVAMRGHREINKDIPKLNEKTTKERLHTIEKFRREKENQTKSFRSHRISVPHVMPRFKLSKLELPALDCSEMEIKITHIEDPTLFYAQYAHTITEEILNELSEFISYDYTSIPCESETARIGDLVIADYVDTDGSKMAGRARIDNIEYKMNTKEVETVQIFFIDYGFTRTFDNIRKLSQLNARHSHRIFEIAPQAFQCGLAQVNPSAITCFDSCWSKKSIESFRNYVKKSKTWTAKIYSVVDRVVRLELFDNVNRKQSFNDMLLEMGFAEKWEESRTSKLDHDNRRRKQLTRYEAPGQLRLQKLDVQGVYYPDDVVELEIDNDPNDRNQSTGRSHDKICIRGPYSPLECSFTGLSRQASSRSVSIERDSVNCVVLEPDYLSQHTRLLVASSVGLGQNTGNINLRDTTLMPNIRGFPALMALLFAPRVQLRADKEREQYVAAICGLGYDTRSMKAYDPEHDAEIVFDCDISAEDMIKVNVIRHKISIVLESNDILREYTEGSLAMTQRKVRLNVIQLLDRRRRYQDNCNYFPSYRWSDIRADDINAQMTKDEVQLNSKFLPLCEQIRLQETDWCKVISANLELLNQIHSGEVSTDAVCKLCKVKSYTRQDLASHMVSNEHMDAVNDFSKFLEIDKLEKKKQILFNRRNAELDGRLNEEDEDFQIFDLESDDE